MSLDGPNGASGEETGWPARILIACGPDTATALTAILASDGHQVQTCGDGTYVLTRIAERQLDLLILDRALPGADSLAICRQLRARWPVPVVMLSANGSDDDDGIASFEAGADDHVRLPCNPRELALRVRALLRLARTSPVGAASAGSGGGGSGCGGGWSGSAAGEGVLVDGSLRVELGARQVSVGSAAVLLTAREFDLLAYLMRHPRLALTREQILAGVWNWTFGDTSTVTVHVRRLRTKLESGHCGPSRIATVRGVGYRYEPADLRRWAAAFDSVAGTCDVPGRGCGPVRNVCVVPLPSAKQDAGVTARPARSRIVRDMPDIPVAVRGKVLVYGADRWLEGLPELIGELEQEWSIAIGRSYPFSTEAVVVDAVQAGGTPAVLKLCVPNRGDAARNEITALRLIDGDGAPKLLRYDETRGALLLERLGRPMNELDLPLEQRHEHLCAAALKIWRPAGGCDLPTGAWKGRWLADAIARMWEELGHPCSGEAVSHALDCAARRAAAHEDERAVLVHGDVHEWNALEAGDGFKLADPDGLLAEAEYDLGVMMREDPVELMRGDPRDLAWFLARRCGGLDPVAIWEWGVAERVSTGLVCTQIGLQPIGRQMLAAAEEIARRYATWPG